MNEIAIEIKGLSFSYERVPILDNVNLSLRAGEFIGVFGPNGGGKTTFLKLLMGFLKPTKGKITLFQEKPQNVRPHIGYVPQITTYDKEFPLSVFELVLMGCLSTCTWWGSYPRKAKEKAEFALKKVGLSDKRNRPFGTLSGGQAQRALIARAIVNHPSILLLDEPTANVDPEAEQEIYHLLSVLKGSMTILMVTHDLQGIMGRVEHLLCINRTVTVLAPDEVCKHFAFGLYHPPLLSEPK